MSTITKSAPAQPMPRSEHPSSRITLRGIAFGFILCALVITGYMTIQKLSAQPLQCSNTGVFNCAVLENSAWAQLTLSPTFAIPTAMLGFLTHVTLFALFSLENRIGFLREWGKVIVFGITVFGFLYHCYLTFYVSLYTFGTLCPYCLLAHVCMTCLMVISGIRLFRSFNSDVAAA